MIICTALIFWAASLLRGILGFTTALVAVPPLLHLGYTMSECVALLLSVSLVQSLMGVRQLRAEIPWPEVRQATVWRLLGLPFGTLTLSILDTSDPSHIRSLVGLMILLALAAHRFGGSRMRLKSEWFRQVSFSSGLLLAAFGTGGPPIVLWTVSQEWASRKSRAFYFALSLYCVPVSLLMLLYSFGSEIVPCLLGGFLYSPVIFGGAWMGLKLGDLLPCRLLRRITLGVLAATGFGSICFSLI